MGCLNVTHEEREALNAIDSSALGTLIQRAIQEKSASALHPLQLWRCGDHVSTELRAFESAITDYRGAKAAKKIAETEMYAYRTGSGLRHSVEAAKHRADQEERESQLFQIDDQIFTPHKFTEQLSVLVTFRWRPTTETNWHFGRVTFTHRHHPRPDYLTPQPKRKPSARKQAEDLQDELFRIWEYLKQSSLQSVRDFFRSGGSGSEIPKTFQAKADSRTQELNNYSADFWRSRP